MKIQHQQGHPCLKKSFVVILNSEDPREQQAAPADLFYTGKSGPGQAGHPTLPEPSPQAGAGARVHRLEVNWSRVPGLVTKPFQTCRFQVCLPLSPGKSTQRARTRGALACLQGNHSRRHTVCPDADAARSTAASQRSLSVGARILPRRFTEVSRVPSTGNMSLSQ